VALDLEISLSVAMVIYNEEKHLTECLESLEAISSDIVIIHDGVCTDKSKDIADAFGAKFYERPRIGMCEGHRIDSFTLTKGEWILVMDADKRLSTKLRNSIPALIKDYRYDAYEFIWPLYDGKKVISDSWPFKRALFRKEKMKYLDFPHAEFTTSGVLKRENLILEHKPSYNNYTIRRFIKKWIPWAKIQAVETLKDFNKLPKVGYHENDSWSKNFLFKRKFPELFLFNGFYYFFSNVKSGGYKNFHAFKCSVMWGLYNACVYYFVMIEKCKKK